MSLKNFLIDALKERFKANAIVQSLEQKVIKQDMTLLKA